MIYKSVRFLVFGIIGVALFFAGCEKKEEVVSVDLSKREALPQQGEVSAKECVRVAIGGMITPREGYAYYKELLDYVGERLGKRVQLVDREDYAEINKLLEEENLDAAFVCSGPYVDGKEKFGMELIAMPQAYGETVYYSYIIVPVDSPVKSFEELRDKVFAFADPQSNTGKLVPTYMLAKMNETPESFFSKFIYSHSHDKSIKAVAQKMVDGAAVDSLIWEYANSTDSEWTSKTRIIVKSPPYGIPPFVVRKGLPQEEKNKLKEIFLNAHNDFKGAEILKRMHIDKFIEGNDEAYNSVREMKAWIAQNKGVGK